MVRNKMVQRGSEIRNGAKLLGAMAAMALQIGCASMSSMQTAEVLEPGKSETAIGGGSYTSKSFTTTLDGKSTDADISVPSVEVSYRRGLTDKIDAGLKFSLPGTLNIDGKYQFVNGDTWDMATGLGLGYLDIETTSGELKTKTTIVDVMVPLHISAKVSENFTPYLSPRVLLRNVSNPNKSGSASILGVTGGVKVGSTWGVYAEYGMQKGMGNDFTASQTNIALFWQ